jgi:hypothetical protein
MKATFLIGCLALVLLIATAMAGRYDLEAFDTTLAPSQSNAYGSNFAVGTANPTVGTTDGSLTLEFTAGASFTAGINSFLAYIPGYECDDNSLSRLSTVDAQTGAILQQSQWYVSLDSAIYPLLRT